VIPTAIAIQIYRRRKTLAADAVSPAADTAEEEG
jgi:hypothetical protein